MVSVLNRPGLMALQLVHPKAWCQHTVKTLPCFYSVAELEKVQVRGSNSRSEQIRPLNNDRMNHSPFTRVHPYDLITSTRPPFSAVQCWKLGLRQADFEQLCPAVPSIDTRLWHVTSLHGGVMIHYHILSQDGKAVIFLSLMKQKVWHDLPGVQSETDRH